MEDNTAKYWFSWFYEKWEKNPPGELIEQGLTPSQIDINKSISCIKCLFNLYIYLKFLVNKDF